MMNKFEVPWKIVTCREGEECWCRAIKPEIPILNEDEQEIFIISTGEIEKELAEYIVRIHNETLKYIDFKS